MLLSKIPTINLLKIKVVGYAIARVFCAISRYFDYNF